MRRQKFFRLQGVSLTEAVVGVAVFFIIAVSVYQAYSVVFKVFYASHIRFAVAQVANEEIEIIRNLAYEKIGVVGGVPPGVVPPIKTVEREGLVFTIGFAIRNIDDPFDGTLGGVPNDTAPADYKLVEISASCTGGGCVTGETFHFTGRISPRGLESASANGALFIQAIDANGLAVPSATIHVVNSSANPPIDVTDTTDTTGFLRLVDVPPAVQSYEITVSKSGYSTDRTYGPPIIPNPVNPHATVAIGQVTQDSFAIDRLSTLQVQSLTETCSAIPAVNFTMTSVNKFVGTSPDVPKFSQEFTTDTGGLLTIPGLEWETYALTFSNPSYDVSGTIPTLPLVLGPGVTQGLKLVMQTKQSNTLLLTVKDAPTGLPLSGAQVTLSDGAFYYSSKFTGRGFLSQTDWSGGSGQESLTDPARYSSDDGNIDVIISPGEVKLLETAGNYAPSGVLTSSTFDTGSPSTFHHLTWLGNQPPETGPQSVRFQFASATTSTPSSWDFLGPDGTSASYYTAANSSINPLHTNDRYFRYRITLQTASSTLTASVSDVAVTFASECVPPGQAVFNGLSNNLYVVTVALTGYQSWSGGVTVDVPWQEIVISLIPQ